jgi:lipopolysaccharide assembly protein A
MSTVRWIVGIAIFFVLLLFSLQNADTVPVKFYGWFRWEMPLVFLLLIAFAAGLLTGLLAGVVRTARLKRQLNRLRREHARHLTTGPMPPTDAP